MIRRYLPYVLLYTSTLSCGDSGSQSTKVEQYSPSQEEDLQSYAKRGDSIVTITFDTLSKTLMQKAQKDGFAAAVELCNVRALPLTSLFANESVSVKRTSTLLRNRANQATPDELYALKHYEEADSVQIKTSLVVSDAQGNVHYYKPILMQALCLNCHGTNITPEIQAVLSAEYPTDKATGYKQGDLRGIWHVYFKD